MSIITISRGSLSGGQALAERLADRLGYRCISSEALIEAAAKYGVSEPKLSEVFEKTPSFWERLFKSRRLYLIFIQAAMCELAQQGKLVYHGQGGQQLLKGISHIMKVRLIAPLEYRLKIAIERQGLASREAARQYLQQVDEERLRRMRYLFNVDWRDPALYDVVLNIEHMSLETAADVVIYMAQHPEYHPTPASEKKLNDLALSCPLDRLEELEHDLNLPEDHLEHLRRRYQHSIDHHRARRGGAGGKRRNAGEQDEATGCVHGCEAPVSLIAADLSHAHGPRNAARPACRILRPTAGTRPLASPPSPLICCASFSARSASRFTSTTFAPSRAKVTAVALPLPQPGPIEPAPTTIAVLPLSRSIDFLLPLGSRCVAARTNAAHPGIWGGKLDGRRPWVNLSEKLKQRLGHRPKSPLPPPPKPD